MFFKEIISVRKGVIAISSLVVVISTVLFVASEVSAQAAYSESETYEAGVRIAPLPKYLEFAGEKVPIELPYVREAIEREVLTTSCMHTSTTIALRNTTRYFPIIEPILKKNNIPDDFKYLCVAESGLNPNAQSPARACGLWQFIASAAKEYGVETGENVDLRYNIEVATQAACDYFNKAYKRFGSWTLVAASYNAGQAGVARRLETQGVNDYWDLFLPEETMRYVPRIVSIKLIFPQPEKYGFHLKESDYFPAFKNYTKVSVAEQNIDWSKFAASHNTNYRQLRILNPWIRSYSYANKTNKAYVVKIPNDNFTNLGY
ncbi:MAG: lytic transglycosylase domain-containing protein [Rikenellaceae bacterium]